jgi:hypothetical protein
MSGRPPDVPGDSRGAPPQNPAPGQTGLVLLGISMGILLMSVQLWLLTLAFNLYLAGDRRGTLIAAIISGCVFIGGLVMLGALRGTRRLR